MPRVITYVAIGLILSAGVLLAADEIKAENEVQVNIVGCADGEGCDKDLTCIKITAEKTTSGDEAKCKIVIVKDGEALNCDNLKKIKLDRDGLNCITIKTDGEDGAFKAIIIENGETKEFDDLESFEAYLTEHPEVECCQDLLKTIEEDAVEEDTQEEPAE